MAIKKSTRKKGKKEAVKKEKVCEIFEVEKDGKEKIIESCGVEKEKIASKEQVKKEYKIFKAIIIAMMLFILMFLAFLWIINSQNKFNVGGVIFNVDKTALAGITVYRTSLPVYGKSEITGRTVTAEYNFWLRNDPRTLKQIDFNGYLSLKKNMVINMTDEFNCEGDGVIAVANLLKLYEIIGTTVIKDENATCDNTGRYTLLNIEAGEETKVEKFGPACYTIYIKDCDILKGTERFMLETFIKVTEKVR
ncbi:hypothetical protein M0R19_06760 [Candidatus Pacearchaeota archaeon]|nr:hypothetical protein [Candidatus Pacearchaeota archaeon]